MIVHHRPQAGPARDREAEALRLKIHPAVSPNRRMDWPTARFRIPGEIGDLPRVGDSIRFKLQTELTATVEAAEDGDGETVVTVRADRDALAEVLIMGHRRLGLPPHVLA